MASGNRVYKLSSFTGKIHAIIAQIEREVNGNWPPYGEVRLSLQDGKIVSAEVTRKIKPDAQHTKP